MTDKILATTTKILVVVLMAGAAGNASATTLSVPGSYPTIGAAFEVAQAGDRIELAPGVYPEANLVLPNGVVLAGVGNGPGDVVIDGQGLGRIILAEGLNQTTLISDISFVNGLASGPTTYETSGGAIFSSNSTLRISNCIFESNTSEGSGGAIRLNNSTPLITGCIFRNNEATSGGGAIDCSYDSSPLIRGCEFSGNSAAWGGALSCRSYSSPIVSDVVFADNQSLGTKGYGGAVFADLGSTPSFQQATFFDNSARYGGALASFTDAETNLENCTLSNNSAEKLGGGLFAYNSSPRITSSIIVFHEGAGIGVYGSADPQVTCSDIFGNSQGDWLGLLSSQLNLSDNLSADPEFCTSNEGTAAAYGLNSASPCGDVNLACGYMGAWPVGCDAVGTFISIFEAEWLSQDAQVSWQARTDPGTTPQFRLTGSRQDTPDEEWEVPFQDLGGGYYTGMDQPKDNTGATTYVYRLYVAEAGGEWTQMDSITLKSVPQFPGINALKAAPNPFNPMTTISFSLGKPQQTRVSVYSPDGRRMTVLSSGHREAGPQSLTWNGQDEMGLSVGSGIYIVLVEGASERKTLKLTLLK